MSLPKLPGNEAALPAETTPVAKEGFLSGLSDNQFFTAGAGVAGLGMAFALFKQGAMRAALMVEKYFTVSLEIPSKDRSYHWVLQWISARARMRAHHLGVETTFKQHPGGKITTHFDYVPSPGSHIISYNGTYIRAVRERDATMIDINSGQPFETVKLTAIGRNKHIFTDLLTEAKDLALEREVGKTVIFTSLGTNWQPFGNPRKRRPLHSVVLPEGQADMILNDFNDFLNSSKWYTDRGIPYRRGYLLYGPPGCGKSSFIFALAGELEYNICILNLNERGLTDDRLNVLLSVAPPRSIILLEDVDAAFVHRSAAEREYSLTFSGLLNALDGVASTEERVVFMTTNHIERLDPALIRPGRVDVKVLVGLSSFNQAEQMFLRFYDGDKMYATAFVNALKESKTPPLSMAHLQGYFMLYKDDPEGAIAGVQQLAQEAREIEQLTKRIEQENAALLQQQFPHLYQHSDE